MTDKEKAKELASVLVGEDQNQEPLVEILMEMAQWKQQQMMKDAINAEVALPIYGGPDVHLTQLVVPGVQLQFGDKVKLIIIKEEGK